MSPLHINVCLLIFVKFVFSTGSLKCGQNEMVDDCPRNCSYEYCPKDRHSDGIVCSEPTKCPPPACKCAFNYRRATNNTCIPTEMCPAFDCSGPNEVFESCPSYCPGDKCSNANPTGECPFLSLLVVNCSPSCRCKQNYWRRDGTCVPYHECPNVEQNLRENGRK